MKILIYTSLNMCYSFFRVNSLKWTCCHFTWLSQWLSGMHNFSYTYYWYVWLFFWVVEPIFQQSVGFNIFSKPHQHLVLWNIKFCQSDGCETVFHYCHLNFPEITGIQHCFTFIDHLSFFMNWLYITFTDFPLCHMSFS